MRGRLGQFRLLNIAEGILSVLLEVLEVNPFVSYIRRENKKVVHRRHQLVKIELPYVVQGHQEPRTPGQGG